jgi:hypothetical protein
VTEPDWLSSTDPQAMPTFLRDRGPVSERKLRLLACACCREVRYQLANDARREAVELSERVADDSSLLDEMWRAEEAARATSTDGRGCSFSGRKGAGYNAALYTAIGAMWHIDRVLESTQLLAARPTFARTQRGMIRDIFGNPFKPVPFEPSWRTEAVVALARGIYEERAWDRMPALAAALEGAGCAEPEVLEHCRGPHCHVRGCWVVDAVLGRA